MLSSMKKSGVWWGAAFEGSVPFGMPPRLKKNAGAFTPKKEKSSAPVVQMPAVAFPLPAALSREGTMAATSAGSL